MQPKIGSSEMGYPTAHAGDTWLLYPHQCCPCGVWGEDLEAGTSSYSPFPCLSKKSNPKAACSTFTAESARPYPCLCVSVYVC